MKKELKIKLPAALQAYTASAESIPEEVKLPSALWQLIEKLCTTKLLPKEIAASLSLDEDSTYPLIAELVEIGVITAVDGTSYIEWKEMSEPVAPVAKQHSASSEEQFTDTVEQRPVSEDGDFLVDELESEAEERVSFEIL